MRSDSDYYYRRAEAELEQAQRATSAAAVKAHYVLAGHYLDRVYGGAEAATGTEVASITPANER